jgi:uncharacterized protein (DUF305 family)
MRRIILATIVTAVALGGAVAQQQMPTPSMDKKMDGMKDMPGMDMKGMKSMMPDAKDPAATAAYKASMMKMMHAMPAFTGDADIDFMKQMRPHHQAAIDMARIVLANGKDSETNKLAQDIITAQEKEIATIDAWLKKKGA